MKPKQLATYLLSVPKTIYFNVRSLPFKQAVTLPIFVSYKVKILAIKQGIIQIPENVSLSRFMIRIGFNGTEEVTPNKAKINFSDGTVIFRGKCSFGEGCVIGVTNKGILDFGDNFSANKNVFISCNQSITFGKDVLCGWNCLFFDAQGHIVYHKGEMKPSYKPIEIGDHVWVCAESHVLKGSSVANGSVVAYRSLLTGKFAEKNILIGGSPAEKIQSEISWGNFSKNS